MRPEIDAGIAASRPSTVNRRCRADGVGVLKAALTDLASRLLLWTCGGSGCHVAYHIGRLMVHTTTRPSSLAPRLGPQDLTIQQVPRRTYGVPFHHLHHLLACCSNDPVRTLRIGPRSHRLPATGHRQSSDVPIVGGNVMLLLLLLSCSTLSDAPFSHSCFRIGRACVPFASCCPSLTQWRSQEHRVVTREGRRATPHTPDRQTCFAATMRHQLSLLPSRAFPSASDVVVHAVRP